MPPPFKPKLKNDEATTYVDSTFLKESIHDTPEKEESALSVAAKRDRKIVGFTFIRRSSTIQTE